MNRREFLRLSFLAGVPPLFKDYEFLKDSRDYSSIRPVRSQKHARVVACRDNRCVSRNFQIDAGRAAALFRKALLAYTGRPSVRAAVRGLFPKFRDSVRVSIKVNTASWDLPSHRVVAEAIASCLVEAGVKPEGISIWERAEKTLQGGGYRLSRSAGAVRVIATDTPGYGYDESATATVNGIRLPLTSILTRHSDYLINLSVMKHHFISGVTGALKNMYGCVPLLDRPFLIGPYGLLKFHLNNCDPCVGELNDAILRRVPTILYVCDALLGLYEGGPWGPPQWVQNELVLSDDPVALDMISLYRVEKRRRDAGLSPVMGNAGHLRTAALMGLGTNNVDNIDFSLKLVE